MQNESHKNCCLQFKKVISKLDKPLTPNPKRNHFWIHVWELKRESLLCFALWLTILAFSVADLCTAYGNKIGIGAGVVGFGYLGTSILFVVVVFHKTTRFTNLFQKKDLEDLDANVTATYDKWTIGLLVLVTLGAGLFMGIQIAFASKFPPAILITIFQFPVVLFSIFGHISLPKLIQTTAEVNIQPIEASFKLMGQEYFNSARLVDQGRGYWKNTRRRCCWPVAKDEIQLTTHRASVVTSYYGNPWNCFKPTHKNYMESWLSQTPGIMVVEPESILCCFSYVTPLTSVSAFALWCFGPLALCSTMDNMGIYDHGPCCPSRHLVFANNSGMHYKIPIKARDELQILIVFYEVTQKWNDKNVQFTTPPSIVPAGNVGYPNTRYQEVLQDLVVPTPNQPPGLNMIRNDDDAPTDQQDTTDIILTVDNVPNNDNDNNSNNGQPSPSQEPHSDN